MAIKKVVELDLKITQSKIKIKSLKEDLTSLDGRTLKYRETLQKLRLEEEKLVRQQANVKRSNESLVQSNNKLEQSTKSIQQSSGLAGATVQELGRGISDLPFGIRGVANNLSQMGSLFTTLIVSAGGFKNALRALGAAMMGPLGILTIFQVFTALIQTDLFDGLLGVTKAQKAYTDALKSGSEAASNETAKLDTLLDTANNLNLSLEERERAISLINENYPEYLGNLSLDNLGTEEQNKLIEKNIEFLNKQALAKALQAEKTKLYQELIAAENSSLEDNISSFSKFLNTVTSPFSAAGGNLFGVAGTEENKAENIASIEEQIADLDQFIQRKIEDSELDITDIFKPKKGKDKKSNKDRGFDTSGDDIFNPLDAILPTNDELQEAFEVYDESLSELSDIEAYWEDVRLKKAGESAHERIEIEKAEQKAKEIIRGANINAIQKGFGILKAMSDKNKTLQAIGIIGENAVGIAKTVINTQAANTAAVLKYAAVPGGQALAAAEITANKINQGISIATSVAATAKALSTIGAGGSTGNDIGTGGGLTQASPTFNVVGQSETNQLAQTVNQQGQQPIKAFVVASEVSTQQALDRNVISTASFG